MPAQSAHCPLLMMERRDYYEILGVERSASETEIKRAYRARAMECHPDRNNGDPEASSRMKEVNEAYAVLCDPQKKHLYDAYGHEGLSGYSPNDIFSGVDFSSLFREFGLGGFGFGDGLFGSIFGRGRAATRERRRAPDLRYDLQITLEEAFAGIERTLEIPRRRTCTSCRGSGAREGAQTTCTSCNGTGQIVNETRSGIGVFRQISVCSTCGGSGMMVQDPCSLCEGKGVLEETHEVSIAVPAGVDTGYTARLQGEGEHGDGDVTPGDLYVVVHVANHPVFERQGDDLYTSRDIGIAHAALGASITVQSLDGETTLKIPEGTQTGSLFRLRKKGMPRPGSKNRGDLYVVVKVVTPTDLTEDQKELLRRFQSAVDERASS